MTKIAKQDSAAQPLLSYPTFGELPQGLVSLNELVEVVNAAHAGLPSRARNRHKEFTASMASNYVKQKLTPPPAGKKYTPQHVSMILFAATIKLAYSTEDVLEITRQVFEGIDGEDDLKALQDSLAETFNSKTNSLRSFDSSNGASGAHSNSLVELTSSTFANKVHSLILLERSPS